MTSVMPVCERAIVDQTSIAHREGPMTVIAIPILVDDSDASPQVICLVANLGDAAPEPFTMLVQLVAAHIAQWTHRQKERQLHWKLDTTAAVAELLAELSLASDLQHAERIVANRMRDFLARSGCDRFVQEPLS